MIGKNAGDGIISAFGDDFLKGEVVITLKLNIIASYMRTSVTHD